MGKINSSDAFDILVKDHKEEILKKFGTRGLNNVKIYFVDYIADMDVDTVDVNDTSIKAIFNRATLYATP